jgi:hypothetical protein
VKDPETGKKVDDYWDSAKKQLLADAKQFMESLVHFDKDNIPLHIIKKVANTLLQCQSSHTHGVSGSDFEFGAIH